MNDDERLFAYLPELSYVVFGGSKALNEANKVINRDLDKLTKVCI